MKCVKNYILLVDSHRPKNLTQRQEKGRYRVGAKTEKEAVELLKAKIKFGSIQVYYEDKDERSKTKAIYKEIIKEC